MGNTLIAPFLFFVQLYLDCVLSDVSVQIKKCRKRLCKAISDDCTIFLSENLYIIEIKKIYMSVYVLYLYFFFTIYYILYIKPSKPSERLCYAVLSRPKKRPAVRPVYDSLSVATALSSPPATLPARYS